MMIYAAASEEIERIGVPEARAVVLRELLDRLPAGDALSRVLD